MARYYYWNKKDTIESTLGADLVKAKHLIKNGWASITSTIRPSGSNFSWKIDLDEGAVRFSYTSTDRQTRVKTDHSYSRSLAFTDCNFGGKRFWFICPCGRRVKALYIGGREMEAYCRHCLKLTYSSTQETRLSKPEFKYLSNQFKLEEEINKLKLKTRYYNGKPTRKYKKYLWLEEKFGRLSDKEIYALEKFIMKS